jgi:hypothetical protein
MQFRCQETNITGVFSPYPGMEETTLELDEIPCLSDCACNTEYYDPVCLDGKTYFSPCFAGCIQSFTVLEQLIFLFGTHFILVETIQPKKDVLDNMFLFYEILVQKTEIQNVLTN